MNVHPAELSPLRNGVYLEKGETPIQGHPRDGPRGCDAYDPS